MAITPLPTPPAPTDSPQDFNTKAFSLLGALPDFVTETNATAVQVDADKTTATGAASTATTKANEASASADLAEDWATKTDGEVAGGEFSAKKYAQDSSDSADEAAASALEAAGLVENYQGALESDPSLNKDGDPLAAGDWYVNTSTGLIRAYTGSVWVTSVNVTAGVSSFSGGSTGLTPNTGTQGDVSLGGTLAASNGGTGLTSPGTTGNVLTSDGTGWTSSAISIPPSTPIGTLQYFAGPTTTTYPGDEWLLADGSIVTQTAYSELFDTIGLRTNNLAINWTARTSGTASDIYALTYANNTFVYAGSGGVLRTSTNGITWTVRTSGTASTIYALIYANNTFVYAGGGGVLATSTDGIAWTARTSGTVNDIYALTYANNTFVYAGGGGVLATSTNGITWTVRTSGTASAILALTYANGTFVYAGSGVTATSTDGITWTARTSGTAIYIYALTYGAGVFVYAGDGGALSTSTNGIAWTARTSGTGSTINALIYADDKFVYAGGGGVLATVNVYTYDVNTEFALPSVTVARIVERADESEDKLFIKAE